MHRFLSKTLIEEYAYSVKSFVSRGTGSIVETLEAPLHAKVQTVRRIQTRLDGG